MILKQEYVMIVYKDGKLMMEIAMILIVWRDNQINAYNVMKDIMFHKIDAYWWETLIAIWQIRLEHA